MPFILLADTAPTYTSILEQLLTQYGLPTTVLLVGAFYLIRWVGACLATITAEGIKTFEHHRDIVDCCRAAQIETRAHLERQTEILSRIEDTLRQNGDLLREHNGKLAAIHQTRGLRQ